MRDTSSRELVEAWARENEIRVIGGEMLFVGDKYLYQLDVAKSEDLRIVHRKLGKGQDVLLNGRRNIGAIHYDFFLHCFVICPEIRDR